MPAGREGESQPVLPESQEHVHSGRGFRGNLGDPVISTDSFGGVWVAALPPFNLHLGFPDQPPKDTQLFAQALEGVENPIFNESNIEPPDGVKGVKKTFDEGNIGLAHANIGSDPNALDWLITQAQSVNVPVK